jgi:hypothetical protein
MNGNLFLIIGSILNFAIAALHIVIIFIGGQGYRYFGAGEDMARMDEAGSWQPALLTSAVTLVFIFFGFYGLAGAGRFRKLPFMKTMLIVIAVIFLIRGAGMIAEVYMMIVDPSYPSQMIFFSAAALLVGICYSIGIRKNWSRLSAVSSVG